MIGTEEDPVTEVVAADATMRPVMALVRKVAVTEVNVVIRGESGTGKDLIARVIHRLSKRANGPYIKIDCASIPVHLVESELFGYEKGAFTDAQSGKSGRFEWANGGTLVLDEIAQVSLPVQAKLLTAIEEKKFQRLSGTRHVSIDARIMALTDIDLEAAAAARNFRRDLLYRLNVVTISLPPLRERRGDIPRLARRLLQRLAQKHRKKVRRISPEAMQILCAHDYPGNIRELRNYLERALIEAEGSEITPGAFPRHLRYVASDRLQEKPTLAEMEKRYIMEILEYTDWNKSRAAKILGIHRKTLLEKRKQYGIQ